MSPVEEKEKLKTSEEIDLEELVLINHEFTQTEHKTMVQALKSFLNSALVPITQRPTKIAISALKRQKNSAENLLNAINSYSAEMAVSENELGIIKRALRVFISLPKPLWQDINQIRKMKNYQDTAASLLDTFDLEEL
ncbi:MAG: hypothetical protein HeimC3_03990 [Candidatus Heimdallarchaeota archaeon LC_3]|nr:MAG: hypothetical protein HeimC3_03990 [Candidatus Heimdallarchaeota archaeon LC_3]